MQKFSSLFIGGLITLVAVLFILRVLIANQLVGASEKLHSLDKKIDKLSSENKLLSENLRQKESLLKIEAKVISLGFSPASKPIYIKEKHPVALTNEVPNL